MVKGSVDFSSAPMARLTDKEFESQFPTLDQAVARSRNEVTGVSTSSGRVAERTS